MRVHKRLRALTACLLALLLALSALTASADGLLRGFALFEGLFAEPEQETVSVTEEGEYTSRDEVALYLHLYGHLPGNYVTKREAERAGFGSVYRTVDEACPGKSIGGSRFGNYEGLLPDGNYRECDIDYHGGRRGAKRIVWSDRGAIYYTSDHYASFERLY